MATDTPTWGPKNKHRLLNTKLPRVDGPFKTTGTAIYTYDVRLPGMLFGRILCAPHARATVTSMDLKPALKIPGVIAAIQGETDIHFEGTPVAAVAATTWELADSAIHAIAVEYNVMPHSVTVEQAMAQGAAAVFPGDPDVVNNVRKANSRGDLDAANAALATCDVVVEAEYRTPTLHHACLETHGWTVDYRGGNTATVYASTQGTFSIPGDAARDLGLPRTAVVAIVHYMGGGFGSKLQNGMEGRMACALSKMTKRPVKLMLTRKEEFLMAGNGVGSWQKFKAGASKDGKAVAMLALQYGMGGLTGGRIAPQPYNYRFPHVYLEANSVHTNVDAARALRAPGNPPTCFAMESLMDELAYKAGLDPLAFRKMNLPEAAHLRQLDKGAEVIGWSKRNPVPGGWPGTLKRGFGCAVGNWGGGGRAGNQVDVKVGQDGKVSVTVGTQDLGTGTRTYLCAIVAEELGLDMADVHEEIGETRFGMGSGSGGSSTAPSLAPVTKSAAFNARKEIAARVVPLLGAGADDVVFNGRSVSANGKSLSWAQACAALPSAGVAVRGTFQADLAGNRTHGASFAEVEVDTETGHVQVIRMTHVQDCGLPLNRLAVESQINGGMVQGVGMALLEGRIDDPRLGVMINSSFMDYKIAGVMEIPEMIPVIDDGDDRNVVVGVGEPPSVPPAAAIANAVFNACGVRVRDLPITPDKILMGLAQNA
jgi:xanthine dehydrogenase YagR molybdenum-binding subunit